MPDDYDGSDNQNKFRKKQTHDTSDKKNKDDKETGGSGGAVNDDKTSDISLKKNIMNKVGSSIKNSLTDDDSEDDSNDDVHTKANNRKKAIAGVSAATHGVKTAIILQMFQMMRMLLAMITQAIRSVITSVPSFITAIINFAVNLGRFIGSAFAGIANFVINGIGVLASGIASIFSVGITAATVVAVSGICSVCIFALVIVGGIIASLSSNPMSGAVPDCSTAVISAQNAVTKIDINALELENAKKIYSVFKTYGLSDEQIAGMLGNWQIESGIDPASIEGIYSEPHNINGPRHQRAIQDLSSYVQSTLSRAYLSMGYDYTTNSGYTASDGKKYPGIGLVQWTGGGAMHLINFAKSVHKNWWNLDFQIAYMLAKEAPTGVYQGHFWNTYKKQKLSAEKASTWFARYFEGNTVMAIPDRAQSAKCWDALEKTWTVDLRYGSSVMNIAKELGAKASDGFVADKLTDCVKSMNYDNSTLANAAVSYAYKTESEGIGNNGTPLYQRVHDFIWNGDTVYQSCDRCVATAVRWSGTDDSFPEGNADTQFSYLSTSDKWMKVGTSDNLKMSDLLPGDIFSLNSHIFMYVGHQAIIDKYPDAASDADSVSASFDERSPGCGADASDIINRLHGQDWEKRGVYTVFRCVHPDNSSTYKNAGAVAN